MLQQLDQYEGGVGDQKNKRHKNITNIMRWNKLKIV